MTYQKLTDYDSGDNTLPLLLLDGGADGGTQYLVDFLDPNSFPGLVLPPAAIASGTQFNNLGFSPSNKATAGNTFTGLGTAGLVFDNGVFAGGVKIALPAACKFGALTTADFVFGITIKRGTPGGVAGNTVQWAGCASNTTTASQWMITQPFNTPDNFIGNVGGVSFTMQSPINEVHQLLWRAVLSAGTLTLYGYKDGVFIGSATGSLAALPVPAVGPAIGFVSSAFGGVSPVGGYGRFTFEDRLQPRVKSIEDFVADEFAQIAGPRFT